eukprot:TRINITY_DN1118_c0_g1_i1.p1 TRINITY_DN1118_c0_g1~~TRINITY_DN1118_c0_g1_i1.p1  ORF type:complete len:1050 (+),score=372.95 TRINITY_DN1118_c0_g1_i1:256-3405(+)
MSVSRWDSIHREAFIPWVNLRLASRGVQISSIGDDFSDGTALIFLLEELSGMRIPRYAKHPRSLIQKVDNVAVALTFLSEEMNLRILGCNPQEVAEGNEKQTLGLLFLLSQYDKRRGQTPDAGALPKAPSHIFQKIHGIAHRNDGLVVVQGDIAEVSAAEVAAADAAAATGNAEGEEAEGEEDEAVQERERPSASVVLDQLSPRATEADLPSPLKSIGSVVGEANAARTHDEAAEEEHGALSDAVSDGALTPRDLLDTASDRDSDACEDELTRQERAATETEKRARKRRTVAEELLETERTYVQGLSTLISVYMQPIMARDVITKMEARSLFSVVEALLGCNQELLRSLEERMSAWGEQQGRISDIFLQLVPYLRMYTQYVNNLNNAMTTLDACKRKSKPFSSFLEEKMETETKGLDIGSFLIMPVQRIPRYVLLLKEILKYTDADHGDYDSLRNAVEQMEEVATYVNEKKREAESLNQVLWVQSRLTGKFDNLTTSTRRYVCEGPLLDMSETEKKNRYIILFNDCLIVTSAGNFKECWKDVTSGADWKKESGLKYKDMIYLERGSLSEPAEALQSMDEKFKCMFQLTAPKHSKTFTFQAATFTDKMRWLVYLDDCLSQSLDAARSRAFNSLEELSKKEDPKTADVILKRDLLLRNDVGDWEKRSFALTKCFLSHWMPDDEENTRVDINAVLSPCKIVTPMDRPHTFGIFEQSNIHYFAATSGEEMFQWITAIRSCTVNALKSIARATRQQRRPWPAELQPFAADPANLICADCGEDGTSSVSLSFGVFLCDDCSNSHRILGTNLKSLKYQAWKPEHVAALEGKGNEAVNAEFLPNVPEYMDRPTKSTSFDMRLKFVRAKYLGELPGTPVKRDRAVTAPSSTSSSDLLKDKSKEKEKEKEKASLSPEQQARADAVAENVSSYLDKITSGTVELYDEAKEVWASRWMKIERDSIKIFHKEKSFKPRIQITLETCTVKRSLKHSNCLEIVSPTHIVAVRTDKWPAWMETIHMMKAEQCASITPTKKKRSSSAAKRLTWRRSKKRDSVLKKE